MYGLNIQRKSDETIRRCWRNFPGDLVATSLECSFPYNSVQKKKKKLSTDLYMDHLKYTTKLSPKRENYEVANHK